MWAGWYACHKSCKDYTWVLQIIRAARILPVSPQKNHIHTCLTNIDYFYSRFNWISIETLQMGPSSPIGLVTIKFPWNYHWKKTHGARIYPPGRLHPSSTLGCRPESIPIWEQHRLRHLGQRISHWIPSRQDFHVHIYIYNIYIIHIYIYNIS